VTAGRVVREVDVLVVGAGPAGLTAAASLARLGVGGVEVLDRERSAGGIPRHSEHFGYGARDLRRLVSGPQYARRLVGLAVAAGANLRVGVSVTGWADLAHLDGLGTDGERAIELETTSPNGLETLRARAVVLATGARERPRAARGVAGTRGEGVYTTGQLQQAVYLYRQPVGRRAVIVGAEHVSFSAALTLHHAGVGVAAMVTSRARHQTYAAFRVGAAARYRFPLLTDVRVRRLLGRGRVEGVELEHSDGTRQSVACDVVVFTGDWVADNELARAAGLQLDHASSGPLVDTALRTSRPGLYAAGNLLHPVLTADAAALDGRTVAESVLADLRAAAGPGLWARHEGSVRVTVADPLSWVAPGLLTNPVTAPPRGRFVLWANDFRRAPRIDVRQGGRELASLRSGRPLVPGRPYEIGAAWLPRVVLDGTDVTVSVR
jgi:thioredoxin reductase